MRLSRLVTKERLNETIEEVLTELWPMYLAEGGQDLVYDISDAVYCLLGELDSVEDLGEEDDESEE